MTKPFPVFNVTFPGSVVCVLCVDASRKMCHAASLYYLSAVEHLVLLGVVEGLVGLMPGLGPILQGRLGHLADAADHLRHLGEGRTTTGGEREIDRNSVWSNTRVMIRRI